jgi:hypothetical protein
MRIPIAKRPRPSAPPARNPVGTRTPDSRATERRVTSPGFPPLRAAPRQARLWQEPRSRTCSICATRTGRGRLPPKRGIHRHRRQSPRVPTPPTAGRGPSSVLPESGSFSLPCPLATLDRVSRHNYHDHPHPGLPFKHLRPIIRWPSPIVCTWSTPQTGKTPIHKPVEPVRNSGLRGMHGFAPPRGI